MLLMLASALPVCVHLCAFLITVCVFACVQNVTKFWFRSASHKYQEQQEFIEDGEEAVAPPEEDPEPEPPLGVPAIRWSSSPTVLFDGRKSDTRLLPGLILFPTIS